MQPKYLSCAETAKLVRAALKRNFPGVKFSVNSSTYSGGASIRVEWIDGPALTLVDPIVAQFCGGNFDGSIDMATSHSSWLMPNGTACIASKPGTVSSGGSITPERNWMPTPDAQLVHFGADHIFTTRNLSLKLAQRIAAKLADRGHEVSVIVNKYDGAAHFSAQDWQAERQANELRRRFMVA